MLYRAWASSDEVQGSNQITEIQQWRNKNIRNQPCRWPICSIITSCLPAAVFAVLWPTSAKRTILTSTTHREPPLGGDKHPLWITGITRTATRRYTVKFLFSTATSATDSLLAECHSVRLLQKCCSGDTFNMNLTFQHPKVTLSHVFLWTKIYKKSFKNCHKGFILED